MDEARGSLVANGERMRRRWRGQRVIGMFVAIVMAVAGSVAVTGPAAAAGPYICPGYAPVPGRLYIADPQLQREAAKIGVCFNTSDTILIVNNTSTQPIRFWSMTPGFTYLRITDDSSAAVQARNSSLRAWLDPVARPGQYVIAGERMQVGTSTADFSWQFDITLAVDTVAVDTAAALAFGKLKKWASSGSKARAAVTTCAAEAVSDGVTASGMDDTMKKLLLGSGPCAIAAASAGATPAEETILKRAKTVQSKLSTADSIIKKVQLADILGAIWRAK